ncbi:universal stress protein [Pseudoalteromonas mariniglutinosa]|uniref:universal stress protein n=1 Tax=Pseudoalteromonas mariniglutinosa TaxID=206042 RepID=UPI00384D47B5
MKKIITCIDGSEMTDAVTAAAMWVASRTACPLHFLHALEQPLPQGRDDLTAIIGLGSQTALIAQLDKLEQQRNELASQHGQYLLDAVVAKAHAAGFIDAEQQQSQRNLVEALLHVEQQAQVMIIGRCGKGHNGNFKVLGSHIETIIRQVHTPVVVIPPQFHQPTNFMLAYDGSDSTDQAIAQIIQGDILKGLACHLVMVDKHDTGCQQKLDDATRLLREHGFEVTPALLDGDVYQALWQYKSDMAIDALVMGAFGHSKLRQFFLGSNTLRMLEDCHIPLVVLR